MLFSDAYDTENVLYLHITSLSSYPLSIQYEPAINVYLLFYS